MGGKQKLISLTAAVAVAGGALALMQAQRPARSRTDAEAPKRAETVATAPAAPAPAAPAPAASALVRSAAPAKAAPAAVLAKRTSPRRGEEERASARPMPLEERMREAKEAAARGGSGGGEGDRDRFEQWFYGQRSYPAKTLPANARAKAIAQAHGKGKTAARLGPLPSWSPLGPSTIPDGQTDDAVGPLNAVSGRVSAIAADPSDANVVYVGGAQGGVWKTTNATSASPTFTPLTDDQPSLAVGDIAVDPVNPQILYVGTGEGNGGCDSYYGRGILRSTDGGATWTNFGAATFTGNSTQHLRLLK